VAERTIREHLQRRGLQRAALAGQPRAFGRFEASRPNELWIGDVLVGPFVPHPRAPGSKRAYLFVLVDDYSRLLLHGRWVPDQNTRAGQDVLRAAIQRRGLPERLYVDKRVGSSARRAHASSSSSGWRRTAPGRSVDRV
jgi:putative transposase